MMLLGQTCSWESHQDVSSQQQVTDVSNDDVRLPAGRRISIKTSGYGGPSAPMLTASKPGQSEQDRLSLLSHFQQQQEEKNHQAMKILAADSAEEGNFLQYQSRALRSSAPGET